MSLRFPSEDVCCTKSTRRNNRPARVLATPTVASAPQRRMKPNTCGTAVLLTRLGLTSGESQSQLCAAVFVVNAHETIARFHGSFALLFSLLFSGHASNPTRELQKGCATRFRFHELREMPHTRPITLLVRLNSFLARSSCKVTLCVVRRLLNVSVADNCYVALISCPFHARETIDP